MDNQFDKLKEQYKAVPIPDELDLVIEKALANRPSKKPKRKNWLLGTAAALALFTTSVNVSPSLAKELAKVPGLEAVVEAITFTKYESVDEKSDASITVPQITGESSDIEHLNAAYAEEGKALYEQYKEIVEKYDTPHFSLTSDYKVITDTEDLLVVQTSVEQIMASSYTESAYANLDRVNGTYITLPQLFIDDRYIERITTYLLEKMHGDMEESNGEIIYWIKGTEYVEDHAGTFTEIDKYQSYYINQDSKLMISFNEGTVAPSYLGAVEIEIPTEVIRDLLVSNKYIK